MPNDQEKKNKEKKEPVNETGSYSARKKDKGIHPSKDKKTKEKVFNDPKKEKNRKDSLINNPNPTIGENFWKKNNNTLNNPPNRAKNNLVKPRENSQSIGENFIKKAAPTVIAPSIRKKEEREIIGDELEEQEEEDIGISRRTRRKNIFSAANKKIAGGINWKSLIKKALPVLIPIAFVILLILLITLVIVGDQTNQFNPILGVNSKTGGSTGGEEYTPETKEEEEFYNRVDAISKEYKDEGINVDSQIIAAVYVIVQNHNEEFTMDDMDDNAIRKVIDAMFDSDGENKLYNEDTLKKNLINSVFPDFIPRKSHDEYEEIAAEVFEYIEAYKDFIMENEDGTTDLEENTLYWWPVGSAETTTENGKLFAKGAPSSVNITSYFAGRVHPISGKVSHHSGMDISGSTSAPGIDNIIATLDGVVVYPSTTTTFCYSFIDPGCGGQLGNYVVIQHADGNFSVYGHMHQSTILVKAGDTVKQGQVIGKMGSSGMSTGTHLHFEIRVGVNNRSAGVDPLNYVDPMNPRPFSIGSSWSLTQSSLSKAEFVAKMKDYCNRTGNTAFCTNFAAHAEVVYDTAHSVGVNPELIVATAGTEQAWKKTCGYNFYGIGIGNGQGCSSGAQYASLEAGIRGFGGVVASYNPGGRYSAAIEQRYNERKAAGCDPAGYGKPGTLQGMQSVYSWLGDYRYNPGSWGKGGCVYLKIMYPNYPYCKPSTAAIDNRTPTTVCEQNDYTAYQLKEKYKIRQDIFGL